jgi:hypothetical protein
VSVIDAWLAQHRLWLMSAFWPTAEVRLPFGFFGASEPSGIEARMSMHER